VSRIFTLILTAYCLHGHPSRNTSNHCQPATTVRDCECDTIPRSCVFQYRSGQATVRAVPAWTRPRWGRSGRNIL